LFAINILGVKLSGSVKNGLRSLFNFGDMKAKTSMRSKNQKMSQKSTKSKTCISLESLLLHESERILGQWWMGTTATKHQKIASGKFLSPFKKFFECFNFDPKYLEKVPLKIFSRFLAKSTKSRVENTNMA